MSRLVENWTYSDVSAWLRQIGFANYVEVFCKNQIDGEVLLTMSESDLRSPPLNFTVFGQIRKLGLALERLKVENQGNRKAAAEVNKTRVDEQSAVVVTTPSPPDGATVSSEPPTDKEFLGSEELSSEYEINNKPAESFAQNDEKFEQRTLKKDQDEDQPQAPPFQTLPEPQSQSESAESEVLGTQLAAVKDVSQPIETNSTPVPLTENNCPNDSFNKFLEEAIDSIPSATCNEPVMVNGSYLDRVREMEELYPDMCWRYQDCQSQLLASNPQPPVAVENKGSFYSSTGEASKVSDTEGFMAIVSHIVSPAEFYLQPHFVLKKINRLIDDMTEHYKDDLPPIPTDRLYENMPCAACFREDNKWYRAVISDIGLEDARIIFVDWGNSQFEPFNGLKPLAAKFGRFPPLTFRCRIHGVRERTLLQKKVDEFNIEMEEDLQKSVTCIPRSFTNGILNVSLVNPKTREDIGQKYLPKEPICPPPIEFYLEEIRQCDLASNAAIAAKEKMKENEKENDQAENLPDTVKETVKISNGFTSIRGPQDIEDKLRRDENMRELDRKAEKLEKGLYASDMEAFLDGAPGFDASDSDEEEAKPKTKRLKQIKREAMLKAQGKWPPPEQIKQSIEENRFFRGADGKEYVKEYMKVIKPPKGGQNVIVSSVVSARELYLHTENQLRFLGTLQDAFQRVMYDSSYPLPSSLLITGSACIYRDEDSLWYRCRIGDVSPRNSDIPLSLVDYGRVVSVSRDKINSIKALPACEHFFSYEVQLFKCKLRYLCETAPAIVESELLRELLPTGSSFFCTFEREREPWRIKLVDPVTQEDIVNRFDREMKERNLEQVAASQRNARFDVVAVHQKTVYTQQKFDEMMQKYRPPTANAGPSTAANSFIASAKISGPNAGPTFPHPASQRFPPMTMSAGAPAVRHVTTSRHHSQMSGDETVMQKFLRQSSAAATSFQKVVRPTQPPIEDLFEYDNDIEAALNGAAIVGGYDEPDVEIIDSDDDTDDDQEDRASSAPLDEATEMKIKKWIETAGGNASPPYPADQSPTSPYSGGGFNTRGPPAPASNKYFPSFPRAK